LTVAPSAPSAVESAEKVPALAEAGSVAVQGDSGLPARIADMNGDNGALHPPAEIDGALPHVVMANDADKRLPPGVEEPESPEMISVDKAG
jgi:hypothetical protein